MSPVGMLGRGVPKGSGGGGAERALLTIDDFSWEGQAYFPTKGSGTTEGNMEQSNGVLAVRRIGADRLYSTVLYASAEPNAQVGRLYEFSDPVAWNTGDKGDFTTDHALVEARYWEDWAVTDQGYLNGSQWGGNGTQITGLYWDPRYADGSSGVLWYLYSGGYASDNFAWLGATRLNHDGTVGQKYGPWAYVSASVGTSTYPYWKSVNGGFIKIPASAQAALSGATIGFVGQYSRAGHPLINYGPALTGVVALPTLPTEAPWGKGSVISAGVQIASFNIADKDPGEPAEGMHRSDDYLVVGRAHQSAMVNVVGGTPTRIYNIDFYYDYDSFSLGGSTNDAFYMALESELSTNLYLRMKTPAVGGTRVWEYKTAGGWQSFSPTFSHGNISLTGAKNNGVFDVDDLTGFVTWENPDIVGDVARYWIRMRVTSGFSTGGGVESAGVGTTYEAGGLESTSNPVGGIGWWLPLSDFSQSMEWIETATKEGIVQLAVFSKGGNYWYGPSKAFIGSTEVDNIYGNNVGSYGYVTDAYTPTFVVTDPAQVRAAAGAGDNTNIGPPTEANWVTKFPNIATYNPRTSGVDSQSPYLNGNSFAKCDAWDDEDSEWIVAIPYSKSDPPASDKYPTLQRFSVS